MRLLDLFCGAGGCAMGYHRAGFEVVGIDIEFQKRYPFEFHQADALEYLAEHGSEFDVIHASPPCQCYSAMQNIHHNRDKHPDLVAPTREGLLKSGKPYVIENVVGAPLKINLMLCGTMFGLRIIRHRIFEINIPMPLLVMTCNHTDVYDPYHSPNAGEAIFMAEAMGIPTGMMTRKEVRQAIPPAYTEWIGKRIIRTLEDK